MTNFQPDIRGILSPYRLDTPCCGGLCLTEGEYTAQQIKAAKGLPLECPMHGSRNGLAAWDFKWMHEFKRVGVKEINSKVNMFKEVR